MYTCQLQIFLFQLGTMVMVQMVSYLNSSCSLIRPCYMYMQGSRDWAGCIQSWKSLYIKIL